MMDNDKNSKVMHDGINSTPFFVGLGNNVCKLTRTNSARILVRHQY